MWARPLTLRAKTDGPTLRIEVDDPSTDPPVLRHPDVHEDRGRGILLVDALATQWGTEIHSDGKTVWFEIDVSTATEEVHGSD